VRSRSLDRVAPARPFFEAERGRLARREVRRRFDVLGPWRPARPRRAPTWSRICRGSPVVTSTVSAAAGGGQPAGAARPQEGAASLMRDASRFSLEEVARRPGTTVGAVKAALHRGPGKRLEPAGGRQSSSGPGAVDVCWAAFNAEQRGQPRHVSRRGEGPGRSSARRWRGTTSRATQAVNARNQTCQVSAWEGRATCGRVVEPKEPWRRWLWWGLAPYLWRCLAVSRNDPALERSVANSKAEREPFRRSRPGPQVSRRAARSLTSQNGHVDSESPKLSLRSPC
jgi:hypothetical protein